MAAKQGTEFEIFSKELYEELLGQHDIKNLKVQHNVSLKGATGQHHQIDVYWEFVLGGVTHKVAVECKDYTSAVSVGRIRDFSAALDDIGGVKGIFLTKVGYQSGAKVFAQGKGIALKTVQSDAITVADFKGSGLITEVHANLIVLMIDNVVTEFVLDNQYNSEKSGNNTAPIEFRYLTDEIFILNSQKEKLYSLHELGDKIPREPENTQGLIYTEDLSNDLHFLDFPNNTTEIKVNAVKFTYDTVSYHDKQIITGKVTAKAIIRDILDGTCEVIGIKRLD
ncbi:hypothetical protein AMD27_16245 (plasmid) [Acinetobacter sp. TGL-Y2]|uniref:restriction endonuclease n=1 Tax=Acinetobacter sp. TGL-Y2 TaxID=1407071 RepID=UPI0007A644D5|nr:restriction endonuclease [Acinetobacter sp. TGL-Y2]AMW80468.1 hypothetical protein AMD27_16245 [Acinetobacter sp. TGL-Y2]